MLSRRPHNYENVQYLQSTLRAIVDRTAKLHYIQGFVCYS